MQFRPYYHWLKVDPDVAFAEDEANGRSRGFAKREGVQAAPSVLRGEVPCNLSVTAPDSTNFRGAYRELELEENVQLILRSESPIEYPI